MHPFPHHMSVSSARPLLALLSGASSRSLEDDPFLDEDAPVNTPFADPLLILGPNAANGMRGAAHLYLFAALLNLQPQTLRGRTTVKRELGYIVTLSIPLVVTFFLQYLLPITSLLVVGQLGSTELALALLAIMTFNITGLAIFEGMTTSLDTLCAQAYGSGNHTLVGTYFQRGVAMMMCMLVPMLAVWWFSGTLLSVFVDDPVLCTMAQAYMRRIALGTPGFILFECGKRFVQAQRLFNSCTYVLVLVTPINWGLNMWLVHGTSLGYNGAPYAVAVVYTLMALFLFLYVVVVDGRKCWGGLDLKDAFLWESGRPIRRLALPGIVMVLGEISIFEALTLMLSAFGTEQLAAQSITSSLGSLVFQIPFAVAVAISTRVAYYVGSQQRHNAEVITHMAYGISCVMAAAIFLILFFGRRVLSRMFTPDELTVELAASAIVVLAVDQIFDCFNVNFAGVLRGQGRQQIGGVLSVGTYYLVALPGALLLGFVAKLEVRGLWMGLACAVFVSAAVEMALVWWSDWDGIMAEAKLVLEEGAEEGVEGYGSVDDV